MTNQINETDNKAHPFERSLGLGPYRFVGMFSINLEAGKQGRPYINPHDVHPNFVRGAGTCAHCGMAILNIYQVMIGNGEVYGVGSDCIEKAGLPAKELSKVQKVARDHAKAKRMALKARKGDSARVTLADLIASQGEALKAKPHPSASLANSQGLTLLDYAKWIVERSNDGGIVIALKRIEALLK